MLACGSVRRAAAAAVATMLLCLADARASVPPRFHTDKSVRHFPIGEEALFIGNALQYMFAAEYVLFYLSAPFCAMGGKSTLLCDSPLCRDG